MKLLKITLMSIVVVSTLTLQATRFHDNHSYHFRHGSYRSPEYRHEEVSEKETPYGIRRETEVESAEVDRGFLGLGQPRLVEKETRRVEYRR